MCSVKRLSEINDIVGFHTTIRGIKRVLEISTTKTKFGNFTMSANMYIQIKHGRKNH